MPLDPPPQPGQGKSAAAPTTPQTDTNISWDDAAQYLESDEYKKLAPDKQQRVVEFLKTHAKASPPPADAAQRTSASVAGRRGKTDTSVSSFLTGEGVKGTPGAIIRQVSGLIRSPFSLAEAAVDNPAKTAVQFTGDIFAQPAREMAGKPQRGEDRPPVTYDPKRGLASQSAQTIGSRAGYTLASILGGDAPAAREAFSRGATTEGLANLLTVPLLTMGAGKILGSLTKEAAPLRKEISSLQSVSRNAIEGKGPADAAGRVAEMQSVLKQVMQREGITDETLRKEFPVGERAKQTDLVGDVGRGNQRILDIARKAVGFVHEPLDAVMKSYGAHPAGSLPKDIATSLRAESAKIGKVNEPLARAISDLADKAESAKTFNDLNELKSHANKMLDQVYSPIAGRAIDATAERAYAYKIAADAIRSQMYPQLQRLSGSSIDLAKLGQREADAIAMRDGLMEHYFKSVAPEQANKEAVGFWEYTLAGKGAPGHSFYSKHIIGRGLEKAGVVPTAGAEMNRQFSRGVGKTGKGMVPEKVVKSPRLGPPPNPGIQVSLGNGAPGLSGTTRSITVNGKPAGSLIYSVSGDTLTIHHVGGPQANYNVMSNTLGPHGISQMAQQLASAHPNIKYIEGIRVGGAQGAAARSVRVPISKVLPKSGGAVPAGTLAPGISLAPFKQGVVKRFPNAQRNAGIAARTGRAAQGTVRGMTPPPRPKSEEEEPEDQ